MLLLSKFVSNPRVSSRRYRVLSGEIKTRSGLKESPVTKEGDEKQGRSAYNKQCFKDEKTKKTQKDIRGLERITQ